MATKCKGVVAHAADKPLEATWDFDRREVGPNDICFLTHGAGICHSDIHQVRDEWRPAVTPTYPMVPGHEITGVVIKVGANVKNWKVGDRAGVGCFVDACRQCPPCKRQVEQYCTGAGAVMTYNGKHKYEHCAEPVGNPCYGGYSSHFVVDAGYAVKVPESLDLMRAAPLLCAGITTFSPLKFYNLKKGERLAVAGCGGLGSMAIKFGKAMGAHVTILSRTSAKKEEALNALGADDFVAMDDAENVKRVTGTFDFIMDTIAAKHDVWAYMQLLAKQGRICLLGIWTEPLENINPSDIVFNRWSICGSLIGGTKELQECLDFCAEHNIACESEVITAEQVNMAYDRTVKGDVKYRFVIDCQKSWPNV